MTRVEQALRSLMVFCIACKVTKVSSAFFEPDGFPHWVAETSLTLGVFCGLAFPLLFQELGVFQEDQKPQELPQPSVL